MLHNLYSFSVTCLTNSSKLLKRLHGVTSACFLRKYVPEVKRLPVKYMFEPWKAPFEVQKKARCIVGDDYPEPVADHIEQRKICVQRLKDLCISLDISGTSLEVRGT